MIDREVRRSDPKARDIAIRIANPSLASQAPKVRSKNRKNVFIWVVRACDVRTINVNDRIIDSVARRTISRWVRCIRNRIIVIHTGRGRIIRIEGDMANGRLLSLVYKTNAIIISFISRGQRTGRADY